VSNTLFQGHYTITVNDPDRLPENVWPDDVLERFRDAMQDAAIRWYEEHPGLLVCQPDVA
jgi:hypothetical protein